MTRKETIEMLKILKKQALSSCNDTVIIDVKKDSFIFVINMSIKALEQEPCEDAVSRQAVLNTLDKRFDSIPMGQTTEILLLRKDLRELPSVTLYKVESEE